MFLIEGRGVALPIVLYLLLLGTNCSLSSTDVDGANAKIRLSYQILKWMEYRVLEMDHYEPFF